jgi:hypothetical protein
MKRLNLYVLERTDPVGYDEYSSQLVAAHSIEDAHQGCIHYHHSDRPRLVWTTPENVTCTLIGQAARGVKPGHIMGDFNNA